MMFFFPKRRHLWLAFVLLMVENPTKATEKVGIASLIAKKPGCVCVCVFFVLKASMPTVMGVQKKSTNDQL